jgi:hypothetical protein
MPFFFTSAMLTSPEPSSLNLHDRAVAGRQHGLGIREVILVLVAGAAITVACGIHHREVVRVASRICLEADLDRDRMIEVEPAMMRIEVVSVPDEQAAIERQPQLRARHIRLRFDVHLLHDVAALAAAEAERVVERCCRPLCGQRMERIEQRDAAARLDLAIRHDLDAGRDAVVVQLELGDQRTALVTNREVHDAQLESLAAAIGNAKVAVHCLPVQRSLQQRPRGHDGNLQGLSRLCRRHPMSNQGGRSRAGKEESLHDKLRRQAR